LSFPFDGLDFGVHSIEGDILTLHKGDSTTLD
jgi:hypothetical protein